MTPLFKKLQLPEGLDEILILNEPEGFCKELDCLKDVKIKESLIQVSEVDFALIFVTDKKQIENRIEILYPRLIDDVILWFAFPKKKSKEYSEDLSLDHFWDILGDFNLKKSISISLNADWSAIRFKKMTSESMTKNKQNTINGQKKIKTSDII